MEYYKNLIEDKLNELVKDGDEADFQVAERWLEGDGFPFDGDLIDLLEEAGYSLSTLKQGAEAIDVIICELLAPIVAQETLDRIEAEEE